VSGRHVADASGCTPMNDELGPTDHACGLDAARESLTVREVFLCSPKLCFELGCASASRFFTAGAGIERGSESVYPLFDFQLGLAREAKPPCMVVRNRVREIVESRRAEQPHEHVLQRFDVNRAALALSEPLIE
jgi:hypothetical protein